MKRLLLLDTETTGVTPTTDCPLEVAWGVYSIPDASLLSVRSCLVDAATYRADGVVPESAEAEALHGITRRMWIGGEAWAYVEAMVCHEAMGCDAIVAHNAPFDRGWFRDETILGMPWIDTCDAVTWPWKAKGRSLEELLAAYVQDATDGMVKAAFVGHRAASDVLTLARLLTAAGKRTDLRAMLARATRPRSIYMVAETGISEERNAMAKAAGFRFVSERKTWELEMADEDVAALPFAVKRVDPAEALRPKSLYAVADTSFSAERNALAKAAGFRWTPDVREWRATLADEDAEKLPFAVRKVEREKEAAE